MERIRRSNGRTAVRALAAAFAALAVLVLLGGCFTLTRPPLPKERGRVVAEGLEGPVEIHRDSRGVAHIIATSDHDAFFAQGYVHAQERFYQMEFWRRIGAGRLSELFGESVLASDIFLRTMGFRHIAEQEYREAPALLKNALDAYAAGVNAYIADRKPRRLAAELALLGLQGLDLEIDPWTPIDSLTWPKVMSLDMGIDYQEELLRLDMIRAVGIQMTKDYFAGFRYDEMPTTIRPEDLPGGFAASSAAGPRDDFALLDDPVWVALTGSLNVPSLVMAGQEQLIMLAFSGDPESGSNQWVVSGEHTESGLPAFANDPHLGMQMPSIWYQISLHVTGENRWNCHGYSFAGMPGIIIGHNDHIIWGMSTANPDVQDLYVELINPENPMEYRVGDQWRTMETRQEVIRIKDADPYFLTVRSTRNGPIVTDHGGAVAYSSYDVRPIEIFPTDLQLTELSMKWTALEPTYPLLAVLLHNRARDFDEFRRALSYFHTPSHNFLYADVYGDIAFVHPGRIPIRGQGSGSLPAPGWDDAWQWQGYIPHDELPWIRNPARGYIVDANAAVMPDGMQLFGEHMYTPGFRAYRAEELVTAAMTDGRFTVDDQIAIQTDLRNEFAARIMPHLLALSPDTIARGVDREARLVAVPPATEEEERALDELIEQRIEGATRALQILADWDLRMHEKSVGASVFAQFFIERIDKTYADQVPIHVWEGPWRATSGYRIQNSLWLLVDDPQNQWWDDVRTLDVVETRDEILARALAAAYAELEERLGRRTERWEWGRLHTLTYTSATLGKSGIRLIENIFNRGPVPISGGLNVLFRNDFRLPTAFDVTHVTSMRMIADLSDWSSVLWLNSPGQSGHPASRHYDDAIDAYVKGEYFVHPWTLEEIRAQSRRTLLLQPGG